MDKHYFKSRELKDFIEKYALWLTIDAKTSLSPANKAVYSLLGIFTGAAIIGSVVGAYYAAAAAAALACWYNKIVYDDYIAGVNNYERHTEVQC